MIQINSTNVKLYSPLIEYFDNLKAQIPNHVHKQQAMQQISKLVPEIQLIHSKHGTFLSSCSLGWWLPCILLILLGMYKTHHFINHSCNPNAVNGSTSWKSQSKDTQVQIQVLEDISPGTEITISYIDNTQSTSDRQSDLFSSFQFKCSCEKCQ